MNLIICLDQKNGWQFYLRRQSMDRMVRQDLLEYTAGKILWLDTYAASQFSSLPSEAKIFDGNLDAVSPEACCFIERGDLFRATEKASILTVYRWDKVYPADKKLEESCFASFSLIEKKIFAGYSHDTIVREVYVREP